MPWAFTTRKWELAARGRDYQLIPTFPRLPGIIPEDSAGGPPLTRQSLRKPSVLSKNHGAIIAQPLLLRKRLAKKNF